MKIREEKAKTESLEIVYKFKRVPTLQILYFEEELTKDEADLVGNIMYRYEREKQDLKKRLAELEDVKVLSSIMAGQPMGIIIPENDLELIKKTLGLSK